MKFPLPLNVLCHCQTIKFALGTMAESLHTWFKDVFRDHSIQAAIWVYLKRQLNKWAKGKLHTIVGLILNLLCSFFKSGFTQLNICGSKNNLICSCRQSRCNDLIMKSNQFDLKQNIINQTSNEYIEIWYIKIQSPKDNRKFQILLVKIFSLKPSFFSSVKQPHIPSDYI